MTKTYAITEEQLQKLFSQMPAHKKEDWGYHLLQSLPLITGEPVGYRYRNDDPDGWTYASAKTVEMFLSDSVTKEPLYTSAQPMQPKEQA